MGETRRVLGAVAGALEGGDTGREEEGGWGRGGRIGRGGRVGERREDGREGTVSCLGNTASLSECGSGIE